MRTPKTSETHPLHLAAVTPAHGQGQILFFMCPGKIQPNAETGPWNRDLETDMNAIADAGVTTLLTLMDEPDIQRCELSSTDLSEASTARNINWFHNPIIDFKKPDESWEHKWQSIGAILRQELEDGNTIGIHCRGGRGRAGLVAARLLVETGTLPDDAITLVRQQRPEAIETAEQEAYVRQCKPVAET